MAQFVVLAPGDVTSAASSEASAPPASHGAHSHGG